MGTLTLENVKDMTYKLLNEYQTITADIDLNVTNRVDEQINLAYQELATKSKISASFWISQFPIDNLLYPSSQSTNNLYWDEDANDGGTYVMDSFTSTPLEYVAASAESYYFEVDGNCNVDIQAYSGSESAVTLSTLNITGISTFTQYTGFVTGAVSGGDTIKLYCYATGTVFNIRNVALYAYTFSGVTASIPAYQPYVEYSISSDFYSMNRVRYRYYDDYRTFSDYRIENDSSNNRKLLISRAYRGEFVCDYWKRPSIVTGDSDTFDLEDAYTYIIPWHVAGTICMSDGFNSRAGAYLLQMYEQKKNQIKTSHNYGRQRLDNTAGW